MSGSFSSDSILTPWLKSISSDADLHVAHGYSGPGGVRTSRNSRHNPPRYPLKTDSLVSTSTVRALSSGTGFEIFTRHIIPRLEAAEHEVILVTCFWAASPTLEALKALLKRLSDKAIQQQRHGLREGRIKVRICFSSRSLFQKLFHTSRLRGQRYHEAQLESKLGLFSTGELPGLDLEVKSLFFRPLSVMHSKFVIIDRKTALLPSCNVSWEDWYEGCVELVGPMLTQLLQFWKGVWDSETDDVTHSTQLTAEGMLEAVQDQPNYLAMTPGSRVVKTVLLPSTHHSSWKYSFWPCPISGAPGTPLNTFILDIFRAAKYSIYIQTPNLTCKPAIDALTGCLKRGVDVTIVSNKRMMLIEQLVTAGKTTNSCLKALHKKYTRLAQLKANALEHDYSGADIESGNLVGPSNLGSLSVYYWHSEHDPRVSHLKLTIIDDDTCILGSGNMDRASWFTSQELGVAFFSKDIVNNVRHEFVEPAKIHHRPAFR